MDSRRLDVPPDAETAARDSQVEALVVDGLDHYFARRYDEAIHLWTRVLFLDRSHARARAYIERARTALAERQRRAEELLAAGHTFIDQGKADAARDLLAEAVATTGEDERASALRLRLERVERAQGPALSAHASPVVQTGVVQPFTASWSRVTWIGTGALVTAGLLVVAVWTLPELRSALGLVSARGELVSAAGSLSVPVLSSADVAMVRARTLYGRGRLAEALRALERVGAENPSRGAADALRIEIQRLLLASGREPGRPPAGSELRTP